MSHRVMRRWDHVTWPFVQEHRDELVAVLPAGSVEQHGPHLPLGTDVQIPVGIADRLVDEAPEWLRERLIMLPPMHYTYAKHSNWWSGTVNLTGATLIRVLQDISREVFRNGISRLVVINGHMESVAFMEEGVREALEEYPECRALIMNWWDFVPQEVIDEVFGDAWPGWEREHAALTETSLMMALYPDSVTMDDDFRGDETVEEFPYSVLPESPDALPPSGVFADCTEASAATGELILNRVVNEMSPVLKTFLEARGAGGQDS